MAFRKKSLFTLPKALKKSINEVLAFGGVKEKSDNSVYLIYNDKFGKNHVYSTKNK